MTAKTFELSGGEQIPAIGLGTWQAKPHEVENAVKSALLAGYKHIDCAAVYGNENEVGDALTALKDKIKREDIWITSKLWNSVHRPDMVQQGLDRTLKDLKTEYLDAYLIHWPVAFKNGSVDDKFPKTSDGSEVQIDDSVTVSETWSEMIKMQKSGKVKTIGVSNFSIKLLEKIIKDTDVVPAINQVEIHPRLLQHDLVDYCNSKGIHLSAYSPLGNNSEGLPLLINDDNIKSIAEKAGIPPATLIINWCIAHGFSVLPKSVSDDRIKNNLVEKKLDQDIVNQVDQIQKNSGQKRFNIPKNYSPKWNINVFDEPAEEGCTYNCKKINGA